jgi:C1A family cysteine protease
MFGFLENQNDNISESQAPSAFRDLPAPKNVQNGDIIPGKKKKKTSNTFSRILLTFYSLNSRNTFDAGRL